MAKPSALILVMEFYGKSFPEAVQMLTGESGEGQTEASTTPPTDFHLPLHNRTADRAIQYLCESRGLNKLDEWLRGLLIKGITGNLSGIFDTVNTKVGEIAGEVGQTPLAWNSGVFSMIRNLSETVIVPIAGVILTFVMCYELIQLVTEKNNLHDDVCNSEDFQVLAITIMVSSFVAD